MVWRSANSVGHINKVKLRRTRLVLGLVTTFGGCSIPVFILATQPSQPGHLSVGRCNEYWRWFQPPMRKKRWVVRSSGPYNLDCWLTGLLYASLIGSNILRLKGQTYELHQGLNINLLLVQLIVMGRFYSVGPITNTERERWRTKTKIVYGGKNWKLEACVIYSINLVKIAQRLGVSVWSLANSSMPSESRWTTTTTVMLCVFFVQDSFYSLALKSLISFSTLILLALIVAYHALEIQVSKSRNSRNLIEV